jgi:predicted aldo/keto reductase-like oxidoreductase
MEYRKLGRTGLEVSAVSMGGIPVQRVDEAGAIQVIEAALKAGINFFDTARAYTDSERKFGRVFGRDRRGALIATKSMARTREDMAREIDRSLTDLQVSRIDLYQLHNVKDEGALEKVLSPDGALTALEEARRQGKISFIGITGHIPAILVKAAATGRFDTVQFPFNAIETVAADELIPLARRMNIGTIAMKPFAGGALTGGPAALRFILEHGVDTVIPGMDAVEQVALNAAAGAPVRPLTTEERTEVLREAAALGERFCRRCEYCQPCPEGIDIPMIFLLDGYYTRYDLKGWAVERYRPLPQKASHCVECGECEARCPYALPIREMLKESRRHMEDLS